MCLRTATSSTGVEEVGHPISFWISYAKAVCRALLFVLSLVFSCHFINLDLARLFFPYHWYKKSNSNAPTFLFLLSMLIWSKSLSEIWSCGHLQVAGRGIGSWCFPVCWLRLTPSTQSNTIGQNSSSSSWREAQKSHYHPHAWLWAA